MNHVFRINRRLEPGEYSLTDVFADIRTCDILNVIFDDATEIENIMTRIKVNILDQSDAMFVSNDDASITIGLLHLQGYSDETLYLDIVHELCHVKQHLLGRDLYDRSKAYVDRETEIDAYQLTVQEARRIGLNDDDISDYLRVAWITPEEHERLARRMGVVIGEN